MIKREKVEQAVSLPKMIRQLEQDMITAALLMTGGNKSDAAKALGLNRVTLLEKMRKYGMPLNKPTNPKAKPRKVRVAA